MNEDQDNTLAARIKSVMIPALCFAVGFSAMLSAIAAGAISYVRHGEFTTAFLIAAVIALAGAVIMIATFRKWPTLQMGEPDTPRTRRLGMATIGLIAFSTVVALFFIAPNDDSISVELYSNSPLPTNIALSAAALWLIGMPLLSYYTRKQADEVNIELQRFGETVAFQFFAVAAPVWWLGYRGGVLPQPDVMILFVAVLIVSAIANYARRI